MTLTLSQAYERTKDLSGAIKAARAHEADCAADHEAKLRIAEIAAEAHNKAVGHCIELERERDELADHIAGLVRKVGEPHDAGDAMSTTAGSMFDNDVILATSGSANCANHGRAIGPGPDGDTICHDCGGPYTPSIFTQPADFQAAALANGEAKLNAAFDRATEGWG